MGLKLSGPCNGGAVDTCVNTCYCVWVEASKFTGCTNPGPDIPQTYGDDATGQSAEGICTFVMFVIIIAAVLALCGICRVVALCINAFLHTSSTQQPASLDLDTTESHI